MLLLAGTLTSMGVPSPGSALPIQGANTTQQQPAPVQLKPEIQKLLIDSVRFYQDGKFPEAVRAAEAALAAAGDNREQALAAAARVHHLGIAAYGNSQLYPAKGFWQAALRVREKLDRDSLDVAASLNNLGIVALDQDEFVAAKDFHQRALQIRKNKATSSLLVALSHHNLGLVAYRQGDLTVARNNFQDAHNIRKEKARGSLDAAETLSNLGVVARGQGDLTAARDFYQQALKIQKEKVPNSVIVADTITNLGVVARRQGDLTAARDFYQQALKIQEDEARRSSNVATSLNVAATLNNLGVVALNQDDLTGARCLYKRALKIQEEKAPRSRDVATSLINLGAVAARQGDLTGARCLYKRALKIQEEKAPGSLVVAANLNNLGTIAQRQDDLPAAQRFYQQALQIQNKESPGSLDVALSLNNLGTVAQLQGRLPTARGLFRYAWRLVRSHSQQVIGDEARRAFQNANDYYSSDLERVLVQLRDTSGALRTLEEGRAQALQQALSERVLERTASPDAMKRYQEALNRERIARADHARALTRMEASRSASADEAARLKSTTESALSALTQARVAAEAAWAEVKRTSPRGALADPMPFQQARASLKPGEIYLAYSIREKESLLYVAPAGKRPVQTLILKIGEKDLEKRVRELTLEITDSGSDPAAVRTKSRALAVTLFPAPALAAIRTAKRVILSPDGPLWDVPWSALVLPTGEKREPYLGLAKPLLFAQSLSLHARTMSASPTSGRAGTALALGGCLFDAKEVAEAKKKPVPAPPKPGIQLAARGPREILRNDLGDGNWKPLPATGPEAQSVAGLYGAQPVTGIDATETEVRRRLAGANIVHFATHGRYFAGDPLLSGVILTAPAPGDPVTPETDGVLEAAEVLDPALKINADVVVLSACGTGRGKRERAEGLVGLVRCWQIAGARSVVASQWSVADASTERLMTAFHKGLKAGLPKDQAMRRAMAGLATRPETAHPFYWAPFLVTGDPRPMGRSASQPAPLAGSGKPQAVRRPARLSSAPRTGSPAHPRRVPAAASNPQPAPATRRIASAAQAVRPGAGGKPVAAAQPRASRMGPVLPRVGTVVTASGSLWSLAGPRRTPLFAWSALTPNMSLALDPGARAVVVLDRGGRFELEGPVKVLVRVDSITLKAGAGALRQGRPTPALGIGTGPRRFPGGLLGGVLRSPELKFTAPTPRFGSLEGPVRVAWTSKLLNVSRSVVRVKSADGKRFLFEKTVEGDTTDVELPETLPRGEWLMVTLSVRDSSKTIGEQRSWVRLATAEEKAAYEALRQRAQEQAEDSIPGLLLAERAIELGLYDAADEVLKRLAKKASNPEVKSSLDALRKRAADELERLSAGQRDGG